MYVLETKKNKFKLQQKDALSNINGLLFGVKNKHYKISDQEIVSLIIYNKKLAHPIAKRQVEARYKKLIALLTELLVSDDDTGNCYNEALNQIEKFRQIIKNKYRDYLTKKELEEMGKQLALFQKEAKNRFLELQNALYINKGQRSSCK